MTTEPMTETKSTLFAQAGQATAIGAPVAVTEAPGLNGREYQSSLPTPSLDGDSDVGAGLSGSYASRLPTAGQSDAPFLASDVSWGPNTSVFDDLAAPSGLDALPYADEPERALEQVSNQWVSPPVIGVDKGLTL